MSYLDALEAVREETLRYYDLPAADLDLRYGPDKWSVRYLLHHLADSESVFFYRIRRVISEPQQVIWAYAQARWAEALDYSTLPLELSRRIYTTSRDGVAYFAGLHYERSGEISFVHSETGLRTLKDEFDKVVWHNRHHLSQIRLALQSSLGSGDPAHGRRASPD